MMAEGRQSSWSLDRRVPLVLIIAMFIQTVGLVGVGAWWMSALSARVTENELDIAAIIVRYQIVATQQQQGDTIAARIDERLKAQGETISRIERLLRDLDRPEAQ